MKNTPRLLIFAVVAAAFICVLLTLKRASFTGENGSGYGVGVQVPELVLAGVLLIAVSVYYLVKKGVNKRST